MVARISFGPCHMVGIMGNATQRPLDVVSGGSAQIPAIRRPLRERAKSTPFATFRVAEQNDCFGATSGHSWVQFDSRSRARPSALGLGATLPGAKPA